MKSYKTRCIILVLSAAMWTSCYTARTVTNLSPAYLQGTPSITSFQDPDASLSEYRTFSVFPASMLAENVNENEIMEKQLLFFLRNCLEAMGYRFVPMDETPDFLATIAVSSEYRETYISPSTTTLPAWVPGKTITTRSSSYGTFDYSTFGKYSSYGWGTYSGQSLSTTYVPGHLTTKTYTRPGYTVGHYYPAAAVSVVDGETLKNVWLGKGAGTSNNSDARVASQLVVTHILGQFPRSQRSESIPSFDGIVGVSVLMLTNDGNNYVPTVNSVVSGSPAAKAGLKRFDMILSIDGTRLVNKPWSEAMKKLGGKPGTPISLEIWRAGQQFTKKLTRADRNDFSFSVAK